jgi:hypothetical protein
VAGTPTGNYTGLLDEVRVYSGALNAEEVGALFVEPGVTTTTTTTSTTSSSSSSTSSAQVTTTVATTTTTTTLPPVCLGGTTISKVAIVVKKVGAPPGDERVSFKGALAFAAGTPAIFDPANKGAQVLIEDVGADDAPILALTHLTNPVPPGVGCAGDGWKKTTYKNGSGAIDPPVCTAGSAGGLKKLKVKDKRAKGKGIAFKVTTKGSTVATIVGPLRGTIVLGATVAESLAGECGVHEFASASCRQKKTTVTCK